jgi:hypothetical protein
MLTGTARTGDPLAPEIVPSDHCVARFRERSPVRAAGLDAVLGSLIETLESCVIVRSPPAWAVSDRPTPLWAITADMAFPLAATPDPGRYIATTCLRRAGAHGHRRR